MDRSVGLFEGVVLFGVLGLLGSALILSSQRHRGSVHFQLRLFWTALIARFALAMVFYPFGLVNLIKDEDASGWLAGPMLLQQWQTQGVSLFDLPTVLSDAYHQTNRGYGFLLAGFFYFTGSPERMPASVLNCFFGAMTVVFAYRIARKLFSEWVAHRVGWWVCFFPSMLIWSVQTLKEPVVLLLEAVALDACIQIRQAGWSFRHLLVCALAVILLIPFRFYAGYVTGVVVIFSLLLATRDRRTMLASLAFLVFLVSVLTSVGTLQRHTEDIAKWDVKRISDYKTGLATTAGSGVRTNYDLRTPTGFGLSTAVGLSYLLLSPFPHQLITNPSPRMALTAIEQVVWWYLFFFGVVPGFLFLARSRLREITPPVLLLIGLGLIYSTTFGNVGLVFRQRAQLLPYLLMFAAVGLEQRAYRRQMRMNTMPLAPQYPHSKVRPLRTAPRLK